jgi:hypothetical protein
MVIIGAKQTASAHNASLIFIKGSSLPGRLPSRKATWCRSQTRSLKTMFWRSLSAELSESVDPRRHPTARVRCPSSFRSQETSQTSRVERRTHFECWELVKVTANSDGKSLLMTCDARRFNLLMQSSAPIPSISSTCRPEAKLCSPRAPTKVPIGKPTDHFFYQHVRHPAVPISETIHFVG